MDPMIENMGKVKIFMITRSKEVVVDEPIDEPTLTLESFKWDISRESWNTP
jgi:hypothetical protein